MSTKELSKKSHKKGFYIGISCISILILVVIFIITYASFKNEAFSFSPYDPNSNNNIANSEENGLQYIISPNSINAYISTSSSTNTQKQSIISRGLTSLEAEGITSGYLNLQSTSQSNNFIVYVLLFVFLLILIGVICSYAAISESSK
uniref:Uncharacterized protein n=1 Tax=viral metagenome TaxID=1070528 RepID=A0A6C0BEY8_9ZZZZ